MKLGLSADAAPGVSAADLVSICEKRGLHALEITFGAGPRAADLAPLLADAPNVRPAGVLCVSPTFQTLAVVADDARVLRAPVIIGGAEPFSSRLEFMRALAEAAVPVRLLMRGPAAEWIHAVQRASVPFAWQIDDSCGDAAADVDLILKHAGTIDYIRLVGGGPESTLQQGRGIGTVMRRLALAGCQAPLVLTPSSHSYRLAWGAWLGRRGGWGCGSAADRNTTTISLLS